MTTSQAQQAEGTHHQQAERAWFGHGDRNSEFAFTGQSLVETVARKATLVTSGNSDFERISTTTLVH